jgi:NADPH2 dehydrogenase
MASAIPKLFQSQPLGRGASLTGIVLKHRVALSPLTRFRNNSDHVPTDLVVQHYEQRSRTPGTLLITDATFIAKRAGGVQHSPGIYTDEQIQGWKKVIAITIHCGNSSNRLS